MKYKFYNDITTVHVCSYYMSLHGVNSVALFFFALFLKYRVAVIPLEAHGTVPIASSPLVYSICV